MILELHEVVDALGDLNQRGKFTQSNPPIREEHKFFLGEALRSLGYEWSAATSWTRLTNTAFTEDVKVTGHRQDCHVMPYRITKAGEFVAYAAILYVRSFGPFGDEINVVKTQAELVVDGITIAGYIEKGGNLYSSADRVETPVEITKVLSAAAQRITI